MALQDDDLMMLEVGGSVVPGDAGKKVKTTLARHFTDRMTKFMASAGNVATPDVSQDRLALYDDSGASVGYVTPSQIGGVAEATEAQINAGTAGDVFISPRRLIKTAPSSALFAFPANSYAVSANNILSGGSTDFANPASDYTFDGMTVTINTTGEYAVSANLYVTIDPDAANRTALAYSRILLTGETAVVSLGPPLVVKQVLYTTTPASQAITLAIPLQLIRLTAGDTLRLGYHVSSSASAAIASTGLAFAYMSVIKIRGE